MESLPFPTTAAAIGQRFGAQIVGPDSAPVTSLDSLSEAGRGSLTFLSHKKFEGLLNKAEGAVIFVHPDRVRPGLPVTYILVPDPQRAFAQVAQQFASRPTWEGISPQASVHPTASLEEGVSVGPFAVIGEKTVVGRGAVIGSHAVVGREVRIGRESQIHSHVVLGARVRIGDRVQIFAGTVVGSDGFGLLSEGAGHVQMPQIGIVVIEDDVRIGAKCTIDRATIGETRIGRGTKIDDQVHIGHNSRVGANCVLCAQAGLSGSSILEDGVVLAGQVGISNGVRVGKGARLAGQSGAGTDLQGGQDYFMSPAIPHREALRVIRYLRKLPEIWQRLKALEMRFGEAES